MILGTLFIFLAVIMPTLAFKNLFSLKWKPFAKLLFSQYRASLHLHELVHCRWVEEVTQVWTIFVFFTDFRSYCLKLWQHVALIDLLFKHPWELSDTVSKINYRNELYCNCYHNLLWTKEADSQLPFFLDSQSKYIEW